MNAEAQTHESFRTPTAIEIRDWLRRRIAETLCVTMAEIDHRELMLNYGLESVEAISIAGELSDWLRRPLSPTLWWDCRTIDDLVEHVLRPQ